MLSPPLGYPPRCSSSYMANQDSKKTYTKEAPIEGAQVKRRHIRWYPHAEETGATEVYPETPLSSSVSTRVLLSLILSYGLVSVYRKRYYSSSLICIPLSVSSLCSKQTFVTLRLRKKFIKHHRLMSNNFAL
ncbi:hypothetical protein L6452_06976 [Arctium lappa]|uniref:Uncharacterized protein n=1 Tax=Arctium lappa TaxID=4217 RepID=A0ACB9ELD8_ARCLA|nr:hypothetical protein L6452_06976 [Arctium lappa]